MIKKDVDRLEQLLQQIHDEADYLVGTEVEGKEYEDTAKATARRIRRLTKKGLKLL